jgi:hypothetical protein
LYQNDKLKEPTKEGRLSFVLFESPFASVSKVSRGHSSILTAKIQSGNGSGASIMRTIATDAFGRELL